MHVGIRVEEHQWSRLVPDGLLAGLAGGVTLGLVQFVISAAREESAIDPFRRVASLVLGVGALDGDRPVALVLIVGAVLHFVLAALFGLLFVVLLAFTFQLSARRWLLLGYGALYGFLLWEINFLAIVPTLFPGLIDQIGFSGQIWNGIVAYAIVYGPSVALYISFARPGVLADWRA